MQIWLQHDFDCVNKGSGGEVANIAFSANTPQSYSACPPWLGVKSRESFESLATDFARPDPDRVTTTEEAFESCRIFGNHSVRLF